MDTIHKLLDFNFSSSLMLETPNEIPIEKEDFKFSSTSVPDTPSQLLYRDQNEYDYEQKFYETYKEEINLLKTLYTNVIIYNNRQRVVKKLDDESRKKGYVLNVIREGDITKNRIAYIRNKSTEEEEVVFTSDLTSVPDKASWIHIQLQKQNNEHILTVPRRTTDSPSAEEFPESNYGKKVPNTGEVSIYIAIEPRSKAELVSLYYNHMNSSTNIKSTKIVIDILRSLVYGYFNCKTFSVEDDSRPMLKSDIKFSYIKGPIPYLVKSLLLKNETVYTNYGFLPDNMTITYDNKEVKVITKQTPVILESEGGEIIRSVREDEMKDIPSGGRIGEGGVFLYAVGTPVFDVDGKVKILKVTDVPSKYHISEGVHECFIKFGDENEVSIQEGITKILEKMRKFEYEGLNIIDYIETEIIKLKTYIGTPPRVNAPTQTPPRPVKVDRVGSPVSLMRRLLFNNR